MRSSIFSNIGVHFTITQFIMFSFSNIRMHISNIGSIGPWFELYWWFIRCIWFGAARFDFRNKRY